MLSSRRGQAAGRDQDGPARRAGPGAVHAGELPRLDRPQPGRARRGRPGSGPAPLPAARRVLLGRRLRRPGHAGGRAADRRLRGERGNVRRGAGRHGPARRGQRPDHPQRVPAQAARARAPGGAGGGRRDHRPGAARLRPAVRPVHGGHRLPRRRPPLLQPARRGVRRGRDVQRRRLRHRRGRGRRVCRAGPRRAHPGPGGAALGHPAARRDHRDPGCPQPATGPPERPGGWPAAAGRAVPRRRGGPLRPPDPRAGARALVIRSQARPTASPPGSGRPAWPARAPRRRSRPAR